MHSLTDRDTAVKKILIITYYWPPAGGPGVQRWLKFSKYLPEFGYDPIIITVDPEKAEYPIKDHTLEQDVRVGQNVYRTNCSGLYEYYKKLTKTQSAPYSGFVNEGVPSLKQKIARFIRGNFFLPDARRGWNKHAYRQAVQIIQKEKIDAVITTGPPMSTHLVGQKLKKRFHLHWIADFRDPWTDIYYYNKMYPTLIAKAIDRKYERNVLLNADQVITVSDYIKKQLAAKSSAIQASKINVIANGFDAEDFDRRMFSRLLTRGLWPLTTRLIPLSIRLKDFPSRENSNYVLSAKWIKASLKSSWKNWRISSKSIRS